MKQKVLIALAIVAVVVVAVFGFKHETNPAKTIRIGAVLGLTGDAAPDALNIKRGIELAKADLAKEGVTVEIDYQDDKTDPKETVSALQYLFSNNKPQAIIGPTWSFLESAAAPVTAQEKIITFAPAVTSEFADVKSAYQFHTAPRNALATAPVTEWIKSHGSKRIAIITDRSGWGVSVDASFRDAVSQTDAKVVFDESINTFSSTAAGDMAVLVIRAKAEHVDLILWTGFDPDATALAQTRERLNYWVPVVAQSSTFGGLLSRKAISTKEAQGVYYLSVPTSQAFIDKFKAAYGEVPGNYAERAYDSLRLEVDAILHAKSTSADDMAAYLRSKSFTGFAGMYEFNEKGDLKGGEWIIQPLIQ